MLLARTGPSDQQIETSSFCLRITPLNENAGFIQQPFISFIKMAFRNFVLIRLSLYIASNIILIVLFKRTFVNNDVTSKGKYQ